MKRNYLNIITMLILLLASTRISGQGLSISTGATFALGTAALSLNGNWSNAGTFNAGTGTVVFNSSGGNQTITNSAGETFYNLTVNKVSGNVQLVNNATVSGTLTCTSGDLDLNGKILTLTGILSETSGNTVKGTSGYITCSSDLNAPSAANPHGIGILITSTSNLGTTTIIRGHAAQSGSGNTGMLRYFEIIPTNNSSLNATLVFNYDESELNSINESTLQMFNSSNNGSSWNSKAGTLDATNNKYTLSGIASLNRYTLASSASPLPVELTTFNATSTKSTSSLDGQNVTLNWQTTTEVNNYGFAIERSANNSQSTTGNWQKIGFVQGNGNSNSKKEYSFIDKYPPGGKNQYRLKQIDVDGKYEYSEIVDVNIEIPANFKLAQNFPNPFNPETTISYQTPYNVNVTIKVYDLLGREIATLLNEQQFAGTHEVKFNGLNLPSGIYLYSMQCGSFIETKKLVLVK